MFGPASPGEDSISTCDTLPATDSQLSEAPGRFQPATCVRHVLFCFHDGPYVDIPFCMHDETYKFMHGLVRHGHRPHTTASTEWV